MFCLRPLHLVRILSGGSPCIHRDAGVPSVLRERLCHAPRCRMSRMFRRVSPWVDDRPGVQ